MKNLEELRRLTEAVRLSGADIAPTYAEYIRLAFALTTDCGEAGRPYFHELCVASPKYRHEDADKLYTHALEHGKRDVHLGTAFFLASQCGVQVGEGRMPIEVGQLGNLGSPTAASHTRARTSDVPTPPPPEPEPQDEDIETPDPLTPLPALPTDYRWPALLVRILGYGKRPQQRDALFLGAVTALGATLATRVRFLYGKQWYGPTLQTFVVAPSASGKGVLSWVRALVEPVHRAVRREVEKAMEAYRKEKRAYDTLGKERQEREAPVPPPNRMFIISGNNSSTGMLENVIDSGGVGIICETEADTVTAALATEYGNWSDTMRKTFEHGPVAFNRRMNHEYRSIERTYLSLLLSGTPSQVRPLIPTAENGLFSRFVFYYIHSYRRWVSQFDDDGVDAEADFRTMGEEWKRTLDGLTERGLFELHLSDGQQREFDGTFGRLYRRSLVANGDDMSSSIFRLAINLMRVMSVVALLRGLEDGRHIVPAPDTPKDNLKDGIVTRWHMAMTDDDFRACLALVEPLYLHATHILSFVDTTRVASRGRADRERLLAAMADTFTRAEFVATGEGMGFRESTTSSWLRQLKKSGNIVTGAEYGTYVKHCAESAS